MAPGRHPSSLVAGKKSVEASQPSRLEPADGSDQEELSVVGSISAVVEGVNAVCHGQMRKRRRAGTDVSTENLVETGISQEPQETGEIGAGSKQLVVKEGRANREKRSRQLREVDDAQPTSQIVEADTGREITVGVPSAGDTVGVFAAGNSIPEDLGAETPKASVEGGNVQTQHSKKKQKKDLYIYGNYHRYYGYRIGKDEDPRLKVLQREWFEGKDCLDVGCNEGYMTMAIAQKFHCKSIIGVDIDSGLVCKARRNLKWLVEEADHLASSDNVDGDNLQGEDLLERVYFRRENFIQTPSKSGVYDTVLCLSVTKWIHLNWGDQGLIIFFSKILNILRPGGILVLEPQPWKSYASKKNVSEVARKNFKEIQLKPDTFPELLIEKIGFKSVKEVKSDVPNSTTGFNRPLFLYYK